MKNYIKLFGIIAVVAIIGFSIAACDRGDNPRDLARQTHELGQQVLGAMLDPARAAELASQMEDIEARVARLSESDRAIYAEELARLTGQGLGGLFDAEVEALRRATDELLDVLNVDDAMQQAADLLGVTGGLLDAGTEALRVTGELLDAAAQQDIEDTLQRTMDAAQQATDLLRGFGF